MASEIKVDTIVNAGGDNDSGIDLSTNDNIKFDIAGSQKASIESDGDVFIGKTTGGTATVGVEMRGDGLLLSSKYGDVCSILRRNTSVGEILRFQAGASTVGSIQVQNTDNISIQGNSSHCGLEFGGSAIFPHKNGSNVDNQIDLGEGTLRFDDIFATNGTIQTSDQNEKQDIASATTKELNVARKLSSLFKTFRWKDKVAEKGDKARTHTGIIAQEIQSSFSAEGLDASNYGLFTSDTWWEKEIKVDAVKADEEKGIEAKDAYTKIERFYSENDAPSDAIKKTRLGVRYPELFSFIFSSIEARLTALESK